MSHPKPANLSPISPPLEQPISSHSSIDVRFLKTIPLQERTTEDLFLLDLAKFDLKNDPQGNQLELSELQEYEKPFLFFASARSYLKARREDYIQGRRENPQTSRDFRERFMSWNIKKNVVPEKSTPSPLPLTLSSFWYIKHDASTLGPIQLSPQTWIRLDNRFLTPTSYGLLRGPGTYLGLGAFKAQLEATREGKNLKINIAEMTPVEFGMHYTLAYPLKPISNIEFLPSFTAGVGGIIYRPNYGEAALREGYRNACDPITGELLHIEDIRNLRKHQAPNIRVNPDIEQVALCQAQEAFNFYFQGKIELSFELNIRFLELFTLGTSALIDYRDGNNRDLVSDIVPRAWNFRWKIIQAGITY